jgi:hypothetical protein
MEEENIFQLLSKEKQQFLKEITSHKNEKYTTAIHTIARSTSKPSPKKLSQLFMKNPQVTKKIAEKQNLDNLKIHAKLRKQDSGEWGIHMLPQLHETFRNLNQTSDKNPRRSARIKSKSGPEIKTLSPKVNSPKKKRGQEDEDSNEGRKKTKKTFQFDEDIYEIQPSSNEESLNASLNSNFTNNCREYDEENSLLDENSKDIELTIEISNDTLIETKVKSDSDSDRMPLDPMEQDPMEFTPTVSKIQNTNVILQKTNDRCFPEEPSNSPPSELNLDVLDVAPLEDVYNIRIPHFLLEVRSRDKPEIYETLHFKQFETFYKTPRYLWYTTSFFENLWKTVISPCMSFLCADKQEKFLHLISSNRFVMQQCKNQFGNCDSCCLKKTISWEAKTLLKDGTLTHEIFYFDEDCGQLLNAVCSLFHLINPLRLLPESQKYIHNAYHYVLLCEKKCQEIISNYQ